MARITKFTTEEQKIHWANITTATKVYPGGTTTKLIFIRDKAKNLQSIEIYHLNTAGETTYYRERFPVEVVAPLKKKKKDTGIPTRPAGKRWEELLTQKNPNNPLARLYTRKESVGPRGIITFPDGRKELYYWKQGLGWVKIYRDRQGCTGWKVDKRPLQI